MPIIEKKAQQGQIEGKKKKFKIIASTLINHQILFTLSKSKQMLKLRFSKFSKSY